MPLVRQKRTFMLGCEFLSKFGHNLTKAINVKIAESLALLADTEDFQTYREEYIDLNSTDPDILIDLSSLLDEFLSDFETKRRIRPLIDAINKTKRLTKRK